MRNCVFAYLQSARLTKTGEIRKYAKDTIRKELFLPVLLRICVFVSEPKKSQPKALSMQKRKIRVFGLFQHLIYIFCLFLGCLSRGRKEAKKVRT